MNDQKQTRHLGQRMSLWMSQILIIKFMAMLTKRGVVLKQFLLLVDLIITMTSPASAIPQMKIEPRITQLHKSKVKPIRDPVSQDNPVSLQPKTERHISLKESRVQVERVQAHH